MADAAPYSRAKAQRILREFEAAVRNDEMRGCCHPDDRDNIHQRYLVLKERMLHRLTGGAVAQ